MNDFVCSLALLRQQSAESGWLNHPLANVATDNGLPWAPSLVFHPQLSDLWGENIGLETAQTLSQRQRILASSSPPQCLKDAAEQAIATFAEEQGEIHAYYLTVLDRPEAPAQVLEKDQIVAQLARAIHQCFTSQILSMPWGEQILLNLTAVPAPVVQSGWVLGCEPDSHSDLVMSLKTVQGMPIELGAGRTFWLYIPHLQQGKVTLLRSQSGEKSDGLQVELMQALYDLTKRIDTDSGDNPKHYRICWCDWGEGVRIYSASVHAGARSTERHTVYKLLEEATPVATGRVAATGIRIGEVCQARNANEVLPDRVVVVDTMDPSWQKNIAQVRAILSRRGGRTSHAAIIAAELGIPAVVGCGQALDKLQEGETVTVASIDGVHGSIYKGELRYQERSFDLQNLPELPTKIMLNIGNPERVFQLVQAPNQGIGLARLEFLVSRMIGIHPRAALDPKALSLQERRKAEQRLGDELTPEAFINELVHGISRLCAAAGGNPVVLRFSDFRSDEYRALIGGEVFEPVETNPSLGFRGAARYLAPGFGEVLRLECEAVQRTRELGFDNLHTVVPFVRTPEEAEQIIAKLREYGQASHQDGGPRLSLMCEVPSNFILAESFMPLFDGMLLGLNDLTQLVLGTDRDSAPMAHVYREDHPAVLRLVEPMIELCRKANMEFSVCGRALAHNFDLATWFVERGVDSLSVEAGRAADLWLHLLEHHERNQH